MAVSVTKAELSGCNRGPTACNAKNIYYLALYQKKFAKPWCRMTIGPQTCLSIEITSGVLKATDPPRESNIIEMGFSLGTKFL